MEAFSEFVSLRHLTNYFPGNWSVLGIFLVFSLDLVLGIVNVEDILKISHKILRLKIDNYELHSKLLNQWNMVANIKHFTRNILLKVVCIYGYRMQLFIRNFNLVQFFGTHMWCYVKLLTKFKFSICWSLSPFYLAFRIISPYFILNTSFH